MLHEVIFLEDNGINKKDDKSWLGGMIVSSMVSRGKVKPTGRIVSVKDFNKGNIPNNQPKKTRKPRKKKEE